MVYISYIGIIYVVMLLIPNFIWIKYLPHGYDASQENRFYLCLERCGEIATTFFAIFSFHSVVYEIHLLLVLSLLCMVMYEGYWLTYFRSAHHLSDFYCSFCHIPLAGATLPIMSFLLLALYQKHWLLLGATLVLGIGHIGIHYQHFCELKK